MPDGKTMVILAIIGMLLSGVGNIVRGVKKLAPKVKHAIVRVVDHQK